MRFYVLWISDANICFQLTNLNLLVDWYKLNGISMRRRYRNVLKFLFVVIEL